MKTLSIIALLCLTTASGVAQPIATDSLVIKPKHFEENVFGIGLHASLVTGMGVSFRHRIAGTSFAYQINGGVIKFSKSLFYSIGGEFQYDLSGGESDRVYATVGGGHYYTGDSTLTTPTRLGVGVGYEFPIAKQMGVSVALLVMGYLPGGDILPLPQIGFHYFFK